ncbi:MAG: ATP-binding cassette domain-containing protein [Bifidobacteriaceae bacterium]|jgi:peptide/nickel transport system ATP-binding protein|nr:ATP-binding cassette domain-containing protein [Bifidobacteriaceae bacterium]
MSQYLIEATGLTRNYKLPRSVTAPVNPADPRPAWFSKLWGAPSIKRAVADVSIAIPEGQISAIIGESGSGKSTLIRLLLGLERPDAGEIRFAGRTVVAGGSAASTRWLRRLTGIVLQDPFASLDPRWPVGRIVAEPLRALHLQVDQRAEVDRVLSLVGLHHWRADQYPHELSGGQRQRVALARAIVHRPRLLIGDEPLSALDVTIRAQILDLLAGLAHNEGLDIALVSHDIGLVQNLANAVWVMHEGQIVEQGPARQVLVDPQHPYTRSLVAATPRLDAFQPSTASNS